MKFKKILLLTIIIIILFPTFSFANINDIETLSETCILIDADSGKILYDKDSHKRMYPASTTKIMTAILTIENCNLTDTVTVNSSAVSNIPYDYVTAQLQPGETFSVEQLLNVLLVASANDAANVLAEHISGSIENFSKLMNKKAVELGCKDTNFVNPSGYHDDNHYSTAYDLSIIAKYCMQNEIFRKFVSTTSCELPTTDFYYEEREFGTTNELLKNKETSNYNYYYTYANGIKTGYTEYANHCLIAGAKKYELQLICVTLGADYNYDGKSDRAEDCINLFNYCFENYNTKTFLRKDKVIEQFEINLKNSETKILDIIPKESLILKTTTNIEDVTPTISIDENLIQIPILKDTVVGKIEYDIDNTHYSIDLITNNDILNTIPLDTVIAIIFAIILFILLIIFLKIRHKTKDKDSEYFDYKNL